MVLSEVALMESEVGGPLLEKKSLFVTVVGLSRHKAAC